VLVERPDEHQHIVAADPEEADEALEGAPLE
jgi:hypothetical protein